jgi:RimJ/RimL family protein N-acetyltransferase
MDSLIARLAGPPEPPASAVGSPQERTLRADGPPASSKGLQELKTAPSEPASPIEFIPYNAIYDPQADTFLPWMWRRMQDDDLVDLYFPGQKETGFGTFVRLFSGDANVALITIPAKPGETAPQWKDHVVGFVSWTVSVLGASEVIIAGFIYFRDFWDKRVTDAAGLGAFDFWFTKTGANIVLGVCPEKLATAMRYNKRIGMKDIGHIPAGHLYKGEPCDAVLYCMTRSDWEAKKGA